MFAKQRFCAKIRLDDNSFVFSSSDNFQSLTVNPRFVRVPTSIFYERN
ncbi:hypothetical protein LEP1GSC151_5558 [Leptospira interrogans serovar Grippotyphosa str. LT2186]|uniref:Uncharacterized protein n=5 Tax=Leptospira interrogans TaxID=173 RepID=M6ZK88_LEPIR|nr:hypothetical protein G436_4520 [Leptospira interrogans serovar Hardjo str. Norma]EKO24907.1 hypothetical protein LEP1GSC104_0491 [Leptospira interrogans str. UI 12621]EKR26306.1 hypothetical protein LEP1GSC087_2409 [Leptospira interrogans serovar Bataviae str. L1111]EKR36212.1 hypothetical protein LEP1GSC096_2271 [Leptospira interrogans serovar Hebdomadis str. R499]EKR46200.1 hypothetical protein LEP1GSC097_1856 [Leptospira interrogans serovar Grippotyphosa str. UI 08368]EKR83591.1 hypothet